MVAVRSKISKRVTKAFTENFDDGEAKSLDDFSAENPLPLPNPVPEPSEKDEHLLQSAPKLITEVPEKPTRRKEIAHRSQIESSITRVDSVVVCNIPTACTDEIAVEKNSCLKLWKTPPQDLFPERGFISLVSLLTILWIALVLSTTTYLSPKLKDDVSTNTTVVTRSSTSSYTQPRNSSSAKTRVPNFYLCDSDFCAKEGNFLKSLLSEAEGVITLKPPEPLHWSRRTHSDLVERALKESLRTFNLNDPYHIERLTYEMMTASDVIEGLADYDENAIVIKGCELPHGEFKLLSTAVDNKRNRTRPMTCKSIKRVQLLSGRYFGKLPEELRKVTANALINHLGFRALVRLAAFMPDSLHALRELSFLEVSGRSEVPDIDGLCLRAMEVILPLCLVKATALPLIHDGTAFSQRRWLSDLEVAFLQALPRVQWLDERALFALAFRLRRIRVDPPYSIDQVRENAECLPSDLKVGNTLEDIVGLYRKIRSRRTLLELRSGPDWRPLSPLSMWPYFDAWSASCWHSSRPAQ
ncbi:hypothetical protein MRX96_041797 [Rhipicephalus microplus]